MFCFILNLQPHTTIYLQCSVYSHPCLVRYSWQDLPWHPWCWCHSFDIRFRNSVEAYPKHMRLARPGCTGWHCWRCHDYASTSSDLRHWSYVLLIGDITTMTRPEVSQKRWHRWKRYKISSIQLLNHNHNNNQQSTSNHLLQLQSIFSSIAGQLIYCIPSSFHFSKL